MPNSHCETTPQVSKQHASVECARNKGKNQKEPEEQHNSGKLEVTRLSQEPGNACTLISCQKRLFYNTALHPKEMTQYGRAGNSEKKTYFPACINPGLLRGHLRTLRTGVQHGVCKWNRASNKTRKGHGFVSKLGNPENCLLLLASSNQPKRGSPKKTHPREEHPHEARLIDGSPSEGLASGTKLINRSTLFLKPWARTKPARTKAHRGQPNYYDYKHVAGRCFRGSSATVWAAVVCNTQ